MPFDPDYASCNLLLHCDGSDASTTFTDSSPVGRTMTVGGNAQIDTAQSKFGGASGLFDGTGDYLEDTNSSDWDFGSGDFTIEFWVRPASVTSWRPLITRQDAAVVVPWSITQFAAEVQVYLSFNNSTWQGGTYSMRYASAFSNGVWQHISVNRSGSDFILFVGGTERARYTNASSFTASTRPLRIGDSTTYGYSGHLEEIGIWKGVSKRTANFTPPPTAWDKISPGMVRSRMSGEMQTMGLKL